MSTVAQEPTAQSGSLDIMGTTMHKRQIRWGWIFLSPWIIGFLIFTLFPMIASLAFTFTDFNLNDPDAMSFVGLDNYVTATEDPNLHTALRVTILFMLISLPFSIIIPLCLALLLNAQSLWGKRLFRTLFYMPFVVPAVSAVGIWNGFLNSQSGWLNRFLESIGIAGPAWVDSTTYIYPALLMIGVWATGNAMLVTLAGLQGVPTELYEAAKVDGAGPVRRVWVITLPMISPVIFYNLILTTIGLFRYFDVPYMLKRGTGDPGNSTLFYNIYFYKTAFTFKDMGYGATQAWGLFAVALLATLVLFYSARFWVYYAGGD